MTEGGVAGGSGTAKAKAKYVQHMSEIHSMEVLALW